MLLYCSSQFQVSSRERLLLSLAELFEKLRFFLTLHAGIIIHIFFGIDNVLTIIISYDNDVL
jgi:hypothetical protein